MSEGKTLFISVVMPVYNAAAYLRDAVQSVLEQSYQHLELILVDDRSTDGSGDICDALTRADERVRVVHLKQNGGQSNARNIGTDAARGDYIFYMDSDDTIDLTAFAEAVASLRKHPAKALLFGLIEEYFDENGSLVDAVPIRYPAKRLTTREEVRREIILLEQATLYGYLWNKLYDLKYLKEKKLYMKTMALNEDIEFNVRFFMDADSLNILSSTPYHYKKRQNQSLTGKFVPEYFELHQARICWIRNQHIVWRRYTDEVKRVLGNLYVRYIFSALQRNCDRRAGMTHQQRRRWICELSMSALFRELVSSASPDSGLVKLMCALLRKDRYRSCLMIGRGIYWVKSAYPNVFARLKRNR